MSYEIRNYSEDYLEKQVEVGNKAYENWKGSGQSGVEQLKRSYNKENNPNFDPETKYYAFKDGELVGFIPATLQEKKEGEPQTARMEFPLVLPGHEEAREVLVNAAFEGLKKKGVQKVLSRAGPNWGYTLDYIEKFNYKFSNLRSKVAEVRASDFESSVLLDTDVVEKLDRENDGEGVVQLVKEFYKMTDEDQIENFRKRHADLPNTLNVVSENVIKNNGKIVGRQLIHSREADEVIFTQAIAIGENKEELQSKLISSSIKSVQESNYDKCRISIFGNFEENEKIYQHLKITFHDDLVMYERDL